MAAVRGVLPLGPAALAVCGACGLLAVSSLVSYLAGQRAAKAAAGQRRSCRRLLSHRGIGGFQVHRFFTGGAVRMPFVPLGISFFTFQQIWYLREVYAGTFSQAPTPAEYLTYSFFFPTVSSGPILQPENFFPQLRETSPRARRDTAAGLYAIGLRPCQKGAAGGQSGRCW
ncbi:MAG: hypothetical protein ACLU38_02805 [Dysosmobacter sp.]